MQEGSHATPLAGLTVIELGTNVAAPYAALQLGEYGATVVKVEAPAGDATRRMGPTHEPGMSPLFLGMNRGKESVALDLKQPAGQAALHGLLAGADVFVHNVRPHKLVPLGLDHVQVRERHPRLVYAGIHGFRADGLYGTKPAYDDIIQGFSGLASLARRQGAQPRYIPYAVADKTVANIAVQAILAALYARERTGQGCQVEIPMFETMVSHVLAEHMHAQHFDPPLGPAGYARLLSTVRRPFQTRDGYICLMPSTNAHWRSFFAAIGREELGTDPRFVDIGARTAHIDALYEHLAQAIAGRSSAEWLELLERLDIPVAPMNELEDLFEDPHLSQTGHFVALHDESLGDVVFPTSGVRFDDRPNAVGMAPRLGEHTRSRLVRSGLDAAQIDAALASGAAMQR